MPDAYDFQAALRERDALVDQIKPILAGQNPDAVGATLAQLLAILHGTFRGSPSSNLAQGC
ncbi:hypothetical protein QIH85_24125 [Bradyrhizobium japonicum]|uniref:hypothetical protein n=1 Tax=Bradyrhizobium japonicum TaxID=375 RepID=UPI002714F498|nr:hypothetical protein [Bradyrhizobium japonicum]WLB24972.1 hypothetical protein QIH85_24125 [Bradyrhizobium japonicum]